MDTQGELIYIGDPLCSWCWGVAPALTQLKNTFDKALTFRILLGGLRPGTTKPMSQKQRDFLKTHWEEIQGLTGQAFNYRILETNAFIYDTEPPSRAVYCVRQIAPMLEFDFFKEVQKAFYADNQDTNNVQTYLPLCENLFLDWQEFKSLFTSPEAKEKTEEDFDAARMLGVIGFPTVLLKIQDKHRVISRGYAPFTQMAAKVEHWLTQHS